MPSVEICTICQKPYEVGILVPGEPLDSVCPECRKQYGDTAKLVCMKCNKIYGRVVPGVKDGGFEVRPGMLLHTRECPYCAPPGSIATGVVEMEEYMDNLRKRKTIV